MNRPARNASFGAATKKPLAAKAAAQRLAQVMSQGGNDEEEAKDDLLVDSGSLGGGIGLGGTSDARPRSFTPKSVHPASIGGRLTTPDQTPSRLSPVTRTSPLPNVVDQTPAKKSPKSPVEPAEKLIERPLMTGRPSLTIRTDRQSSNRSSSALLSSISSNSSEQPPSPSSRSVSTGRSLPLSTNSAADIIQPGRSPMSFNSTEHSPSARSGRPGGMKTVQMVPAAVTISLKQQAPASAAADSRCKRSSLNLGSMKLRKPQEPNNQVSSTALQDQIDLLQDENDSLIEKLRLAEERFLECEARSRQLEKQVANLGEGVSMEARFLSRKEAALQQRESALRIASQTHRGKLDQIATLMVEAENAKEEANSAMEQLHESKSELRSLRMVVQRLILTQEEMEEVVLKRCWLARYWGLCVRYGIFAELAEARHEYWSSFAPLPLEIVIATGQKAKDDNIIVNNDAEIKEKHFSALSGEGHAETMLMLDKGLKEMAQLKVEDAIKIAMSQRRKKSSEQPASTEDSKSPSQKYVEDYELSREESEEVQFKQSWLIYFWRRAKNHGLESDLADDRLQYWINNSAQASTSHDAVDAERGIVELRKLGIETQLWEESRRWLEQDSEIRQTDF